ncbi:MAG: redoxin domain-containing protein [Hyphomonadaceae bacterium]|nr:redoxin domain-containing protein [Hyphomonadaceae bacterium]
MSASAKMTGFMFAAAVLVLGSSVGQVAADPQPAKGQRVEDFQLSDQNYVGRRLYKMRDAKAVVLISYAAGDPAVRADASTFMALKSGYGSKGVEFLMIDSVLGETREKVRPAATAAGIDIPILFDYEQLVGESLNLRHAAEVIVVDPKTWTIAFRGPAGSGSATRALDALVDGKSIALPAETPRGRAVNFPLSALGKKAKISYVKDVAPIVEAKCAVCHQPGGLGPMPLTRYEEIKAFAPMIREALRTRRMPPFQPDITVGHWAPNEGLSSEQLRTLVHWIEAGAPRGSGGDPLARIKFQAPEWPLGKPDLVLNLPEVDVPAAGVLPYQKPVLESGMTEGRWMKASAFLVSDRRVLHHITTGLRAPNESGVNVALSEARAGIGGQGPGRTINLTPPDMGIWIPAGSSVALETHYTPYGKATTEKTKMGLYFYPKGQEPKYPMRVHGLYDMGITIPAGAEFHPEIAYEDIPKDMMLYGLTPHAHVRGASTQVSIVFPDGREQVILAVPKYQFDWQCEYYLAEPILVPAGSRIINRWTYDNSTRNFGNPAPDKDVIFGEQSWDEMLTFFIHYRWVGETVASPLDEYDRLLQQGHLVGVLDDNMDGKLQLAELRGKQGEWLKASFANLDANKDGVLVMGEITSGRRGAGAGRDPASAASATAPAPTSNHVAPSN